MFASLLVRMAIAIWCLALPRNLIQKQNTCFSEESVPWLVFVLWCLRRADALPAMVVARTERREGSIGLDVVFSASRWKGNVSVIDQELPECVLRGPRAT